MVAAWGVISLLKTPIDALPDLSDVQVIIRTTYPGPGAAHRREPGHLPVDDDDAVGAGREDGTRLFVLRRLVRLRAVRRRHRSVLGALARARVPEPGAVAPAARRQGVDRPGCDRRRLDLPVRAGRSQGDAGRRTTARAAGLVPEVRAEVGAQCRRGRVGRRHGAPVPGACSIPTSSPPTASRTPRSSTHPEGQPGNRRLGARARRSRVHGACLRLSARPRRLPQGAADDHRCRRVGAPRRRGAHPDRPGDAPRHRRARRRRRSGRRRDRDAIGQERARDDRRGQGEDQFAARRACRKASRSFRCTTAPA